MRIALIYGTRPEAIKLAPIILKLAQRNDVELITINTGQHRQMTREVEEIFQFSPDYNLDIMVENQTLNHIVSSVIVSLDSVFRQITPDCVIVQGDTATVMAASICAFNIGVPVAHVEAGLRSNNIYSPFPEEFNRRVVSIVAKYNFVPTKLAEKNLLMESVDKSSIFVTGNTIVDAVNIIKARLPKFKPYNNSRKRILITAHRRENHGQGIENIIEAVKKLVLLRNDIEFFWPIHPNPNVKIMIENGLRDMDRVQLMPPLSYLELMEVMNTCSIIWTDSGGIQEEAPSLKKPVLILRDVTERPEVVSSGFGQLTSTNTDKIVNKTTELIDDSELYNLSISGENPFGDGMASDRIIESLMVGSRQK